MNPELTRKQLLDSIPRYYSPWLHLAGTTGVCVAALVLGAWQIRAPVTWLEVLMLPLVLLLSNGVEWRAHKDILHHPRPGLRELYRRHTPQHHGAFNYEHMEITSARELKLVLLPVFGVAGIVTMVVPIALLANRWVSPNAGWFVVIASGIYVFAYEIFHMSYHLPVESPVGRMRLVRALREHHRRHHVPALMQRWNFNVTAPLFDCLHRTVVPEDILEEALGKPGLKTLGSGSRSLRR